MKIIRNEKFKTLKGKKKLQYIWDYYKLPLVILGILLYIFGYISYHHFSYKDTVLYTALVNVNAGETLTKELSKDFLDYQNLNPSKNKLELYTGLYLTDNEQNAYYPYTYASRIKILAVIDGELLDVVLMNKESFDSFSQNGYLYHTVKSDFAANIFILEDNSAECQFDASVSYYALTEEHYYGIDLSRTEFIGNAGFKEPVYLGIIANSPHVDTAVAYIKYLFSKTIY